MRQNGKCVWDSAKGLCDLINTHDDLVRITSFREYREAMNRVMMVIKEAHNREKQKGTDFEEEEKWPEESESAECKDVNCHGKREG